MRIRYQKKYLKKKHSSRIKYKNFNTLVNVANLKFYKEFKKNEIRILNYNIASNMVISLIPKFN